MRNYSSSNTGAFTLIELMLSISIFFVIVAMTSSSYFFFQKKSKMRVATKEISQSINEAKNLAINGYNKINDNLSVGVYFDTSTNDIKYYSYPFTLSGAHIVTDDTLAHVDLFKERKLPDGISVDSINGMNNTMFFFNSITGRGEYFYYDSFGDRVDYSGNEIEIDISYKGALTSILQRKITYFMNTNIVDY